MSNYFRRLSSWSAKMLNANTHRYYYIKLISSYFTLINQHIAHVMLFLKTLARFQLLISTLS